MIILALYEFLGKLLLFENDLKFFFEKKGKKLIKVEIDDKFKVEYSLAVVRERRLDGRKKEKVVKMSLPYPNTTADDIEEKWSYTVSYEKGSEHSHTKGSGWSVGAELAPFLEVFGVAGSLGSIGISYDKSKEDTTTVSEVKTVEERFERTVHIPPNSTKIAKHVRITKEFNCIVDKIGVSFNPKRKVKCIVQKLDISTKGKPEEKEVELHEFLQIPNTTIPNKDETVHYFVSANYEWKEIINEIRFDTVDMGSGN